MWQANKDELARLEKALEVAGVAWWWMEMPSGTVFFSEAKTNMLKRSKEDFFHYSAFTELVHPDDHGPMMASMKDLLTGKSKVYETLYRIKHSDGSYKRFYDKGTIVSRKGNEIELAGVVIDIDSLNLISVTEKPIS